MTHIDGRRQRHLSKVKDYKKQYGCKLVYGGLTKARLRSKTRRYLNQPVQQLRGFYCQLTDDCECPGCNFDDLYRDVVQLWSDGRCRCGVGLLVIALNNMIGSGRDAEVEPLLRSLFGSKVFEMFPPYISDGEIHQGFGVLRPPIFVSPIIQTSNEAASPHT